MKWVPCFWRRLKLKDKLLVISIPSAVGSCAVIMVLALFIFRGYEKSIYDIAVQNLFMVTKHIEREFAAVEDCSVDLITDRAVQNAVKVKDPEEDISMEQILLRQEIYKALQDKLRLSRNIVSISIFEDDEWYYVGRGNRSFDKSLIQQVKKIFPDKGHQLFWYTPQYPSNSIYGIRSVWNVDYGTFTGDVRLVIEYDLKGSIEDVIRGNDLSYSPMLAVMDQGKLLYSSMGELSVDELTFPENKNYSILTLQEKRHFAAKLDTPKYGWEYIFVIPYEEIFGAIQLFRVIFFLVTAVMVTVSCVYCGKLSKMMTRQFSHLTERMKSVQKGNFEPASIRAYGQKDELEEVCERFEDMVANVDRLIQENYVKQMLIRENQLKMLQNQINPHFLFNTLQLVSWKAKESNQEPISEIAQALGKILRYTLREDNEPACLRDEVQIMMRYVTIQKIRYQEKLNVTIDIPEELGTYLVPKLALQNIVENSIKYALENMLEPCDIHVSACLQDGVFCLSVRDNGPGIQEDILEKKESDDTGKAGLRIGLANIKQRIGLLFPDGSDLILKNTGTGTLVEIRIVETI